MNQIPLELDRTIQCLMVLAIYYVLFRFFWSWVSRSLSGYLPNFPEVRYAWRGIRRGVQYGAQGVYTHGYAEPRNRRGRIYGLWVASIYMVCLFGILHLLGLLGIQLVIIPVPIVLLGGFLIYLWHAKIPNRHALPGRQRRRRPRNTQSAHR